MKGPELRIGEGNGRWKGGMTVRKDGRVMLHAPNHPHKSHGNYVYRYRLVMEECLGRFLEPYEVVHHINGIVNDDRPENLEVMHQIAHNRFSARSLFHANKWARRFDYCVECKTIENPHKGHGLCSCCWEKRRVR